MNLGRPAQKQSCEVPLNTLLWLLPKAGNTQPAEVHGLFFVLKTAPTPCPESQQHQCLKTGLVPSRRVSLVTVSGPTGQARPGARCPGSACALLTAITTGLPPLKERGFPPPYSSRNRMEVKASRCPPPHAARCQSSPYEERFGGPLL